MRLVAAPGDGRSVKLSITDKLPSDRMGDCTQYKDHYLIRIRRDLIVRAPDAFYLVLAHEWAHALSWSYSDEDHSAVWGVAYSRCWRIIANEVNPGDIGDLLNAGMDQPE